jgi:hypothetical protein
MLRERKRLDEVRDARKRFVTQLSFFLQSTCGNVRSCLELWASAVKSRLVLKGEVRLRCVVRKSGSHERSLGIQTLPQRV